MDTANLSVSRTRSVGGSAWSVAWGTRFDSQLALFFVVLQYKFTGSHGPAWSEIAYAKRRHFRSTAPGKIHRGWWPCREVQRPDIARPRSSRSCRGRERGPVDTWCLMRHLVPRPWDPAVAEDGKAARCGGRRGGQRPAADDGEAGCGGQSPCSRSRGPPPQLHPVFAVPIVASRAQSPLPRASPQQSLPSVARRHWTQLQLALSFFLKEDAPPASASGRCIQPLY